VPPSLGVTRLVDGADVGVLEQRQSIGLALEHPDLVVVDELATPDDLESDATLRVLLLGFEDDSHPTLAELAQDSVLADCWRKIGREIVRNLCLGLRQRGIFVERNGRVFASGRRLLGIDGQITKGLFALNFGPIRIVIGHG